MLTQKDYDKISHIKEQDFITIMTAVQGGVDWEQILICLAKQEYEYALKLLSEDSDCVDSKARKVEAVKQHQMKADKICHYLDVFRKLNA